MKEVTIDLLTKYSYLSNLQVSQNEEFITFVETTTKEDLSDYKQSLYKINPKTNEISLIKHYDHKIRVKIINNDLYLITRKKDLETVHTLIQQIDLQDGHVLKEFMLPLAISDIKEIENYYLISATITLNYPNYHHLSLEEQLKIEQEKKDNDDYVIFDEYPFFFNGAGIINKDRNTLFLVNKETLEIKDIIKETIDVESYDLHNNQLIYSGVDYKDVKGLWGNIYSYDLVKEETHCIYNQKMQINKVFFYNNEIKVYGTYGKEYGAIETGKFYTLKDNEMILTVDSEVGMYNSIASDLKYGSYKSFFKYQGTPYFVGSVNETSVLHKYEDQLEVVLNPNGSCEDFIITQNGIYFIGSIDTKLQEIYFVNKEINKISSFNDQFLNEYFISIPQKVTVYKDMNVDGFVMLPKDYDETKKYPAILDIHGGPKAIYSNVYYHEMQVWASLGYVVMYCNPRGSDGKGNQFADLRGHMGDIDYEDIMDFVDEVIRLYPCIDQKHIAVTGGSYGGYMTNWIIGHTDRFVCAAAQRSISNRLSKMMDSDYGVDLVFEQEFKDIYNCEEELWNISPLKYANNAKTPTLFIHSTNDYRCPINEALQMYTVLKCRGIPSKIVAFKDENHDLSRNGKPLHRIKRLEEITEWTNKYCK